MDLSLDLLVNATDLDSLSTKFYVDMYIKAVENLQFNHTGALSRNLNKFLTYQIVTGNDYIIPKHLSWLTLYSPDIDPYFRF